MDRIEELIKKLDDSDPTIREQAAKDLGETGDLYAVKPLIKSLSDDFIGVRIKAAEALGKAGDNRAVIPLIEAMSNIDSAPGSGVRFFTIRNGIPFDDPTYEFKDEMAKLSYKINLRQAIIQIGPPAIEVLVNILKDKELQYLTKEAVVLLGNMGESSAVEPVIDILENTDDRTLYFEAARTLLKIGSIRSLKVINLILKYKGKYQKCRIISMTGDIKRDYASDLAIEALEDSDWGVRWTAVKALAHKRGYRIKEALINTLKDVDFNVRKAAEDALNQFKLT